MSPTSRVRESHLADETMAMMTIPLHLGPLHPVEQALTLLLAFGPFVVLTVVVVLRRRADRTASADDPAVNAEGPQVKTGMTAPPRSERS